MDMEIVIAAFMFLIAIQAMIIFLVIWLLRKRQVWGLMMAGIRGYGSLFIKSHFNRAIEIVYTDKPKTDVEWQIVDKASGKTKKVRTFIKQIYHNLKGSNINVHFCPITQALNVDLGKEKEEIETENINLNSGTHVQISTEELNIMLGQEYLQGARDEARHYPVKGMSGFERIQLIATMILIVAAAIQIYLLYTVSAMIGTTVM